MTNPYKMDWWDKLSLDNLEYKDAVGVHVFRRERSCRLFRVDSKLLTEPDCWEQLYKLVRLRWGADEIPEKSCPNCGSPRRMWERRYQSIVFCGRCRELLP